MMPALSKKSWQVKLAWTLRVLKAREHAPNEGWEGGWSNSRAGIRHDLECFAQRGVALNEWNFLTTTGKVSKWASGGAGKGNSGSTSRLNAGRGDAIWLDHQLRCDSSGVMNTTGLEDPVRKLLRDGPRGDEERKHPWGKQHQFWAGGHGASQFRSCTYNTIPRCRGAFLQRVHRGKA